VIEAASQKQEHVRGLLSERLLDLGKSLAAQGKLAEAESVMQKALSLKLQQQVRRLAE
jgi:Flp pilus assembly protein TadD